MTDLENWLDKAILWWKAIESKIVSENQLQKEKEIKAFVKRRCKMIVDEHKRMLTSILEKPCNKVTLDRILVEEEDCYKLVVEPEEHFKKQFRRRNPHWDQLSE